jgi:uncharacterized membrane protein
VTRAKKDNESDRSASVPAARRGAAPLRGLEFWDRVLGSSNKTRNAIRLACAVTVCVAVIIAVVGGVLIVTPNERLQWVATVLLSSAGTALTGLLGIRIRGRRRANTADDTDDTDGENG